MKEGYVTYLKNRVKDVGSDSIKIMSVFIALNIQ